MSCFLSKSLALPSVFALIWWHIQTASIAPSPEENGVLFAL